MDTTEALEELRTLVGDLSRVVKDQGKIIRELAMRVHDLEQLGPRLEG